MSSLRWCRSFRIYIVLCASLVNTTTVSGISPNREPSNSATPAPLGKTEPVASTSGGTTHVAVTPDSTSVGPADEVVTLESASVGTAEEVVTVDSTAATRPIVSELTSATTILPVVTPEGCEQKAALGVCVPKWLIFRANVNSSLVTVTDSLFCVQSEDIAPQSIPGAPQYPVLGNSYDFSPPIRESSNPGRDFYMVDDVIQTYFSNSFVRSLLYQPYPGSAAAFCINRNPAKFLRSVSLSCTRMLTPQSCTTDPNLNADSYFVDMSLIMIPKVETASVSGFLIPVTPLAMWATPSLQNNLCRNVVKKVEFVIGYTSRGELVSAQVNIILADVDPKELLLQTHSVQFQLAPPSSLGPNPADGLRAGSLVIGRFNGELITVTTLGASQSGQCTSDPSRRAPILFAHNTITGCSFTSLANDCSELQSQVYGILLGLAIPDEMAMNSGSQLNWTRVITQECPINLQETCRSGCTVPSSLSIRVLWARQGLLDLPQNYILGAKYLFHCQNVKCPVSSPLALTTEVTFADTSVYPEPPRGLPQPNWKFPFGFFTRGHGELDRNIVGNGSENITYSLMLLTVILLFFNRILKIIVE